MENYVHVKKIGEGSFGKALLVKRKEDGRQCVIKEISISKMSPKEKEDSRKEVKVLSQLKHPNIVHYRESFEGNGNLYIVMDYCEGGDLYQYIVNQRGVHIEESKVLDMFVQCCLATKHIHDRKILHRDIKTQNIFLTKHCIVKLGDFGIARVLKSTMELARTCIGTPYYLSPEIVENRPYNNKSDIWSLGCVLYEMATLKHAFEAGNMKNLVLKIVRGSYSPVANRYSFELRSLVAQCFKRNPSDRPSINSILKKPVIQQRISKFLSPEEVEEEFRHTILHRHKFKMMNPVSHPVAAGAGVVRKPPAKRPIGPAAVYGVSVAKKPVPVRKALAAVQPGARPKKASEQKNIRNSIEKKKELDARERRRKELVAQEQRYQDYMKKIHKQRWEKQQATQMNRAREVGWKNVLSSDEQKKNQAQQVPIAENKDAMKKYQPFQNEEKAEDKKEKKIQQEEKPEQQPVLKPVNAWGAANEAKVNALKAADAAERARVLEGFWQIKREAVANRDRGNQDMGKIPVNPLLQFHNAQMAAQGKKDNRPPIYPGARNREEMDYLKQLEAIRKQNYMERKAVRGVPGNVHESKQEPKVLGDPRYDPDARRRKIEALKQQAEQRSVALRQQLESRKKQAAERLEKERLYKMQRNKELKNLNQRPLPRLGEQKVKQGEKQGEIITPAVGIATAMNQVAQPKLFRSCSEGDIQEILKPVGKVVRKNWGIAAPVPLALANLPLEITSSAMEATTIDTKNKSEYHQPLSEEKDNLIRKQWEAEGKTQFVFMLHNLDLVGTQMPDMTIKGSSNTCSNKPCDNGSENKISETITLSKQNTVNEANSKIGETITLSPKPNTVNESNNKIGETITLPPKQATSGPGKTITISPSKATNIEETVAENVEPRDKTITFSKEQPSAEDDNNTSNNKVLDKGDKANNARLSDKIGMKLDVASTPTQDVENDDKIGKPVESENAIDISQNETKNKVEMAAKIAWTDGSGSTCAATENEKDKVNSSVEEEQKQNDAESDNEESFHTSGRAFGLQTGCYDTETKHLRTCSLPDLRHISPGSPVGDSKKTSETAEERCQTKSDNDEKPVHNNKGDLNIEDIEEQVDLYESNNLGNNWEKEGDVDNTEEDEDVEDEEFEEFESMLESMKAVLSSTAHSPSSTVVGTEIVKQTADADDDACRNMIDTSSTDEQNEGDEDAVEWESDEEDDDNNEKTIKQKEKDAKFKENLFSRIEESRKALEDELGMNLFIKVYRHVQMIQDNEDDELELGTSEISELLGDKEHLYQKILYLVMADSAYCEGNDGLP